MVAHYTLHSIHAAVVAQPMVCSHSYAWEHRNMLGCKGHGIGEVRLILQLLGFKLYGKLYIGHSRRAWTYINSLVLDQLCLTQATNRISVVATSHGRHIGIYILHFYCCEPIGGY